MSTETIPKTTYVNIPFGKKNDDGGYDHINIAAETTDTPGLVVTPAIDVSGFSGGFSLTHTSSGMSLPIDMFGVDVEAARRCATELGKLDIDWTQPQEHLAAAIAGRRDDIRAAISRGRWTYEDAGDTEPGDRPHQPGEYPRTAADATADNMIASLVRSALQRYTDGWELIRYKLGDAEARDRFLDNAAAMLSDHGCIAALRVLIEIDPVAADGIARNMWFAYDDGGSVGEELAEWGAKYGIPIPAEISDMAKRAIAASRPDQATTPTGSTAETPAAG